MIQGIITIIIVVAAIIYAGYRIFIRCRKKPEKDPDCSSCSSDCSGCPLLEQSEKIKKTTQTRQKQTL